MVICEINPIDLKGLVESPPASISNDDNQSVPSVKARLLVDCRCHLGECVIWDDRQNAVLFTSILDRKFHKLCLLTDHDVTLQSFSLKKMLCAFGLLDTPLLSIDDGGNRRQYTNSGYIVGWEDGFQLYDLERGVPLGSMSKGEVVNGSGLPDRLNDGRVDPSGRRFVCGGCTSSKVPLKVYKCEFDSTTKGLQHSVMYDQIWTTNSICWSLTGEEMYLADSPSRNIRKFTYDVNEGTIANEEVIHTKMHGFPDGSAIDSQGFLWNATWREGEGTGMVDRIDPSTGDVVFTVHLPDETSEASCCCFGGKNLDILFITTAYENIDSESEPHAGGLYAVKLPTGMKGCQEKRFRTY